MLRRCVALALLGLCGCHDVDQITQYKAPKEVTRSAARPSAQGNSAGSAAWFLKLTGPAEKVGEHYEAFVRLMSRFRVDDTGKPSWEAPEGWAEVPPKDLDPALANARYATLRLKDSEPPLDITVTTLPSPDPTAEQYIQMNVNRWRRQLQMEPLEGDDWLAKARETKELALFAANDGFVAFANLKGKGEDGAAVQTLAAIIPYVPGGVGASGPTPSAPPNSPMPPKSPAGPGLKYATPEGWTETRKPLASVAFTRTEGDQAFDVTVIRLGGGGGLLPNVNRWRGQIGLEAIQEDALKTTPVPVGELTGQLIDLQNGDKALMTVVIPQGDAQWFVKLMGSNELAQKERDKFLEFAKSIRFE